MKPTLYRFLFLALGPVAIVISAALYRLGIGENTSQSHDRYAASYIAEWRAKEYVSLSPETDFREALAEVPITQQRLLLSPDQDRTLRQCLQDFFAAYHEGKLDSFLTFVRPADEPFVWRTNSEQRLALHFKEPPQFGGEPIIRRWYEKYKGHPIQHYLALPKESQFSIYVMDYAGGNYYSNYWQGVCLNEAIVHVYESETLPEPLWKRPFFKWRRYKGFSVGASFPNLGYASQKGNRFFDFEFSLETALQQNRSVIISDSFFFVQCSAPDTVLPVLLRLYWNPVTHRWLPEDLLLANIRTFYDRFPVF